MWRKELLSALERFELSNAASTASKLESVLDRLGELNELLPAVDKPAAEVMRHLVGAFRDLCYWLEDSLAGDANSERHLKSSRLKAVLALEQLPRQRFPEFSSAAEEVAEAVKAVADFDVVKKIARRLNDVTVPVLYMAESRGQPTGLLPRGPESEGVTEGPFVVKVMFEVDGRPWSAPQLLRANAIYDLDARVTVPEWPRDADRLEIDYVSTLAPEHYKIALPAIGRPATVDDQEFVLKGNAEFPVPQSVLSRPLNVLVRAAFFSSGGDRVVPATVVGYNELSAKISDETRTPALTRYRSIDERTSEIVEELDRELTDLNPQHRADFLDALSGVANYLGVCLQQAKYKDGASVSESQFQEDLLYHLRTLLGEDVQEAPKQGGGPTDVQYRSVTVELKVEKKIGDRRRIIERYLAQPTQYSSAIGAQLGILCVLDLTKKDNPPANPKNQITLETPPVHGVDPGNTKYPTKIAVVVIDGNLRLPSSYSR